MTGEVAISRKLAYELGIPNTAVSKAVTVASSAPAARSIAAAPRTHSARPPGSASVRLSMPRISRAHGVGFALIASSGTRSSDEASACGSDEPPRASHDMDAHRRSSCGRPVRPCSQTGHVNLPQTVPGGMSRVRAAVPLLNQRPVPGGVHHDVDRPVPVTVTLRWATGTEELDTVALEWTRTLVRVRIADLRVMTGAVWLPAEDVRRPRAVDCVEPREAEHRLAPRVRQNPPASRPPAGRRHTRRRRTRSAAITYK